MNLKQANTVGVGALFPIVLSTPTDKDGNDEYVDIVVNGVVQHVKKVGWYPSPGLDLVKNNLTAIFVYQLGERFRQENFGARLWECVEEPNTQVLSFMAATFVKDAIQTWEQRITNLKVDCTRDQSKLFIRVRFSVDDSETEEAIVEYDNLTNSTYAYQ